MDERDERQGNSRSGPVDLNYARDVRPPRRVWPVVRLGLGVCLATALVVSTARRANRPTPPPPPVPTAGPTFTATAAAAPEVSKVYREDMVPLLDRFDQRNREAADRAVANMRERITGRRSGIKPFIADVMSWGTRFGVIGKMSDDVWQKYWHKKENVAAVNDYVNGKFRHYVLSEQALERDVAAMLAQFREDLEASRNQLYVELRLPMKKVNPATVTTDAGFTAFQADVRRRAAEMAPDAATDSVRAGLATFVAGCVATDVGQAVGTRIVAAILSRVGTQMAIKAAAMGGATAGGAAAGGTGGSLGGPAGTVIGIGVGLAIGALVDWWLSEKFEAQLTTRLNEFFDSVEHQLIKGTDEAPGLEKAIKDAVRLGGERQRAALIEAMKGAAQ